MSARKITTRLDTYLIALVVGGFMGRFSFQVAQGGGILKQTIAGVISCGSVRGL